MQHLKQLACILCAALALSLIVRSAPLAEGHRVELRDHVCMMQDTLMEKPGIPVEHGGKTYYGCCAMCGRAIRSEPDRYTKSTDPVSGATVDKADALVYGYRGRAYFFESAETLRRFAEEPGTYARAGVPAPPPRR